MRIYKNKASPEDLFIIFRPTQMTYQGGLIHVNRTLVDCNFIGNETCEGLVHHRFQLAFNSFIDDEVINLINTTTTNIYLGGHSLGGSFVIFMGVYIDQVLNKTSNIKVMLGLAGPFIGDKLFSDTYITPLYEKMNGSWYQIETIDKKTKEFDGTVEGYNVGHKPDIYIYEDLICGIEINKLTLSYGMHDLKNYMLFFQGLECSNTSNHRKYFRH